MAGVLNNNRDNATKNFSVGENENSRIKQDGEKDDNTESRVKQHITKNSDLQNVQKRDVLYYAKLYLENGLNVIPIKYKDKKPAIESWKEYQTKRVSEKEVEEWFSYNTYNIGIICGEVSGNLVVLDFDDIKLYDKWYQYVDTNYIDIRDILLRTWKVTTGKGVHIYLRLKDGAVGTTPGFIEHVDIKGRGGYVVAPPSVHKDTGKEYEFDLGPNDTSIAVIDKDTFNEILKTIEEIGGKRKREKKEETREKEVSPIKQVTNFRTLNEEEISKVIGLAKKGYKKGYRNQLCLFLSGWLAEAKIHPLQAIRVIKALHDSENDEEPLVNRCKPIVYSYAKAGYDLTEFKEDMERECGGTLSGWEATGGVKGVTGIQEILENLYDEKEALSIIQELQDVLKVASPNEDSVFEIMDRDKRLFAVANPKKKIVVRAQFGGGGYKEKEIIVEAYPSIVEVYENPIGGITKYHTIWLSNARHKPIEIGPATADEIVDYLRAEGLVKHKDLAYNYISALLVGYVKKGKAITKSELESPGFYRLNGKIEPSRIEIRKPSKEELKDALVLLNDLAEKWFSHIKDRFAVIVKWAIISPFGYVYKQRGEWIKWLYLYGTSKTGKSTLAEIILSIWGLDSKYIKTGANIDNIARLGYVLSQGTFPIVVNEPGDVVKNGSSLIDPIKNAIDQKVVRGAYRHGNYVDYPSLAMLVFTSNRKYPNDDALLRRLILIHFVEPLADDKIKEFDKTVRPQFSKLKALGDFVAYAVVSNNELLKDDWESTSISLLELAYREAGLDIPQWIYEKYEEEETDIYEDNLERVREFMLNSFMTAYHKNIAKSTGSETPKEIVARVLRENLIPWVHVIPKDGYNEIRFTIGLIDELGPKIGDISLRQLAKLLGWDYKVVKINGKPTKAIVTNEEDLYKFLFPQYTDEE